MMKQENKEYLESHRYVYDQVIRAETATKANAIRHELHRIMKEEFFPGYAYDDMCGSCLFDLVKILYRRFDEWKAANPDNPNQTPPVEKDAPLIVATSFPDQKPEQGIFYKGDASAAPIPFHKHKHRRR